MLPWLALCRPACTEAALLGHRLLVTTHSPTRLAPGLARDSSLGLLCPKVLYGSSRVLQETVTRGRQNTTGNLGKPTWAGRGWKGTFGCSQVQSRARSQSLGLLGHSTLYCTPFASPGKKMAVTFTLRT